MTIVVYYVGKERIRILGETKKFDEKIYAYIFVIFLVPHFWIPFVGWGKRNSIAFQIPIPIQLLFYIQKPTRTSQVE